MSTLSLLPTPRLLLEFDLLIFSFGQLPLALVTWVPMFLSTLLAPYQALRLWARPGARGTWTLGAGLGCALLAAHALVLCALPVHVAVEHQLPPASRCVLVFEQVRAKPCWGTGRNGWAGPSQQKGVPERGGRAHEREGRDCIGRGGASYRGRVPYEGFGEPAGWKANSVTPPPQEVDRKTPLWPLIPATFIHPSIC